MKIETQAGRPTRKTKRHFFLAKHGFLQKHSAWGQIHCWWRQNKGLSSLKRTYQDLASYTLAFPSCNLPAHKYLREVHRHTHTHIHTHTHTHTPYLGPKYAHTYKHTRAHACMHTWKIFFLTEQEWDTHRTVHGFTNIILQQEHLKPQSPTTTNSPGKESFSHSLSFSPGFEFLLLFFKPSRSPKAT